MKTVRLLLLAVPLVVALAVSPALGQLSIPPDPVVAPPGAPAVDEPPAPGGANGSTEEPASPPAAEPEREPSRPKPSSRPRSTTPSAPRAPVSKPAVAGSQSSGANSGASALPAAAGTLAPITDPDMAETLKAYHQALRADYRYQMDVMELRRSAYMTNSLHTQLVFWLVVMVVLAGIGFSWLQFRATLKRIERAGPAEAAEMTELSIGKDGVKLNTSTLGVIILAMSLGFFYLYILHVYPVIAAGGAP